MAGNGAPAGTVVRGPSKGLGPFGAVSTAGAGACQVPAAGSGATLGEATFCSSGPVGAALGTVATGSGAADGTGTAGEPCGLAAGTTLGGVTAPAVAPTGVAGSGTAVLFCVGDGAPTRGAALRTIGTPRTTGAPCTTGAFCTTGALCTMGTCDAGPTLGTLLPCRNVFWSAGFIRAARSLM